MGEEELSNLMNEGGEIVAKGDKPEEAALSNLMNEGVEIVAKGDKPSEAAPEVTTEDIADASAVSNGEASQTDPVKPVEEAVAT